MNSAEESKQRRENKTALLSPGLGKQGRIRRVEEKEEEKSIHQLMMNTYPWKEEEEKRFFVRRWSCNELRTCLASPRR